MNLKWFGSLHRTGPLLTVLCVFLLLSCTDNKIKGDPKKTLGTYVGAIKKGDFETIYKLNRVTARQLKYVGATSVGDVKQQLEENYKNNQAKYDATELTFTPNVQWAEKHFFPPSCVFELSPVRSLTSIDKGNPNALYEEGFLVISTVSVRYPDLTEAPELDGKKISSAKYDCYLNKIREGGNVRIYDVDDKWYVGGCILEAESVEYYKK
ncbi:hypothetical protein MNBD_NITROSPINAE01-1392 [hydrothermal vent metagenome]|uniref:Lipoprotein n=1 Tax=hydrothermal vent metagenome TaxID=652676 RepID=A0A3B1CJN9_9ZZZZ